MTLRRTGREVVLDLAGRAALETHRRMPQHCGDGRVAINELARDLDVTIKVEPGLQAPARWHRLASKQPPQSRLWDDPLPGPSDIVLVRPELGTAARRFAIAHELAHILLHRGDVRPAAPLALNQEELFANAFAAELLVPLHLRHQAREAFRLEEAPTGLTALANSVGVSLRILLRLAARERWMAGIDRVWLDVRVRPNRFTGLDERPRIFDAVLDRHRWFLPGNRSVRGALGDDRWLATGGRRARMNGRMDISRWVPGDPPRSVHEQVPVSVESLWLQRPGAHAGVEILARVAMLRGTA